MKSFLLIKPAAVPIILACAVLSLVLSACQNENTSSPGAVVEAYLNAMISKDSNAVSNLSCSDWEAQSQVEFNSFAAVTARLEELSCNQTGQEGDAYLVNCTGKIVANYNGEDLEIDLEDNIYQVVEEGGDLRMCGYYGAR